MIEIYQEIVAACIINHSIKWAAFLFLIAGFVNSILDTLSDPVRFGNSIFKKLNKKRWLKTESWKNKYKSYPTGELVVLKYDKNNKPIYKPKFWQSTKSLSFLTDVWHFTQFVQWSLISWGFALLMDLTLWSTLVIFLFIKLLISSGFSLGFDYILRSRSK